MDCIGVGSDRVEEVEEILEVGVEGAGSGQRSVDEDCKVLDGSVE